MSDWTEVDGPLAAWKTGSGRERVVFAHGFTQTSQSWRPIAEHLAALGYETLIVDMPGHGGSAHVRADLRLGAGLLTSTAGRGTYVGYSMGGRFCLHAALMFPNLVRRLALIGAHPGIDDDDERARRRTADDDLATHMAEIGIEAFVDEWTAQPLFGGMEISASDRADRLRNTVEGLTNSLRLAGTGTQLPIWHRLRELMMPVMVMAGERDEKYTAIGQQIAEAVNDGTFVPIAGAAHAAHIDRPESVAAAIVALLDVRVTL